jgi:hypothetical protein
VFFFSCKHEPMIKSIAFSLNGSCESVPYTIFYYKGVNRLFDHQFITSTISHRVRLLATNKIKLILMDLKRERTHVHINARI